MASFPYTRECGRFGLVSFECPQKHSIVQKEISALASTVSLLYKLLDVTSAHGPLPAPCDVFDDSLIIIDRLRSVSNDNKLGIFERHRLRPFVTL